MALFTKFCRCFKKKARSNDHQNKSEQTETCRLIDDRIWNGTLLSPEHQHLIYNNEKNYSQIVNNYSNYTKAIVWMNFFFKLIYFVGSCILLFVVTKALLDVVYYAIEENSIGDFLRRMLFSSDESVERSSKIELLLTSLTAFITAVIVIPLTITNYLFNQKEIEQFTALVTSVQQHNEKMLRIGSEALAPDNGNNSPSQSSGQSPRTASESTTSEGDFSKTVGSSSEQPPSPAVGA